MEKMLILPAFIFLALVVINVIKGWMAPGRNGTTYGANGSDVVHSTGTGSTDDYGNTSNSFLTSDAAVESSHSHHHHNSNITQFDPSSFSGPDNTSYDSGSSGSYDSGSSSSFSSDTTC